MRKLVSIAAVLLLMIVMAVPALANTDTTMKTVSGNDLVIIDEADLLIATTSSDEVNIVACLVAKKLGVQHTIARIRNPEYEKQLRFMRSELGLSLVINPEKAVAREISRVLRFPNALKVESFSKRRIELVEYKIGENNPLTGMQLSSLYGSMRVKVLVCAVARGRQTIIPTGDFVFEEGDRVFLTASPKELENFFRHLGLFKAKASSVMIVGASKMSYYLAAELTEMGTVSYTHLTLPTILLV